MGLQTFFAGVGGIRRWLVHSGDAVWCNLSPPIALATGGCSRCLRCFVKSSLKIVLSPAFRAGFATWSDSKNGKTINVANSLSLVGERPFLEDSGMSRKSSQKQASWTKNLGTGKELDLGLTGTALKPFFGLRQGAIHCKLQCVHKFRSRKKHVAALQKLRDYRRFLGRGARNAENIASFEKTS